METGKNAITDISGIRVGHCTNSEAATGCTVVLCEAGAIGGVDQRGGAPGTRETDALHPLHLVQHVHAIVLAGGSAFGLDAATGVVRYLEEQGIGFDVGVAKVPIVPAAILFDLGIGRADIRPDAEMGYQACLNAGSDPPEQGNVGAGSGATVGKILGMPNAMMGGIGNSSIHLSGGIIVGAIVAVNPFGDIIDPASGSIIAGARRPTATGSIQTEAIHFADTMQIMQHAPSEPRRRFSDPSNTVIGVVVTNARLSKEEINKVAQMAQDGIARAVRPAHTMVDGDTLFALSFGDKSADVNIVGAFAAQCVSQAIVNAVRHARTIQGLPSASDLFSQGLDGKSQDT